MPLVFILLFSVEVVYAVGMAIFFVIDDIHWTKFEREMEALDEDENGRPAKGKDLCPEHAAVWKAMADSR